MICPYCGMNTSTDPNAPENPSFCPNCGSPLHQDAYGQGQPAGSQYNQADQQYGQYDQYGQADQQYGQTDPFGQNQQYNSQPTYTYSDPNGGYGQNGYNGYNTGNNPYGMQGYSGPKIWAVLAYLLGWPGFLIALLVDGKNEFTKFHLNQALVLNIVRIVLEILSRTIAKRGILSFAVGILGLAVFVFAIIGIVNAAQGKMKELPLFGSFHLMDK